MVGSKGRNVKLPFIQEYKDRHGKERRYFRRDGYQAIPLPLGDKTSLEFLDAYRAATEQTMSPVGRELRSLPNSVSSVIAAYYESPKFRDELRPSSQAARRRILEVFRRELGDISIDRIEQRNLVERLGQLRPGAARNWLISLQQLFRFAVKSGRAKADPTIGIEQVKPARKSDDDDDEEGHQTWPEEWITQYEAYWPIDTKQRLAMALPLYTAQRFSDVVRMGKGMVKDGVMTLRQVKTGMPVDIELDPRLLEIIAANNCGGDMVYLKSRLGKSYSGSALRSMFRKACDEAGLPKEAVMHGLRKAWARRAADKGSPEYDIMAVGGWATSKQVQQYTKRYDRRQAARRAIAAVAGGR